MHRMKRLKGMDPKRLKKRLKSRRGLRERGTVRETPKRSRCTRCCRCRGVFSATWTSSRSGGGFSVGRGSRWAPSSAFCSCDGTTRGFGSGRSAPRTPRTPRFFSKTDPATTTTTRVPFTTSSTSAGVESERGDRRTRPAARTGWGTRTTRARRSARRRRRLGAPRRGLRCPTGRDGGRSPATTCRACGRSTCRGPRRTCSPPPPRSAPTAPSTCWCSRATRACPSCSTCSSSTPGDTCRTAG
mmetsp:Transcript_7618/g.30886  ORF Transcript_7618/g.30886 Transcript_7618/m.30886 type:complete len:243 (-) Transcript_7618:141-869(-)